MSDLTGHWSTDEDAQLCELPAAAQLLYLRGLRRFVGNDGIAGVTRRLSERSFIELLTVPSIRGRNASKVIAPTRDYVRGLLRRLIKAGLVTRAPKLGPFVFYLPYAVPGQSARRKVAPINAKEIRRRPAESACRGNKLDGIEARMGAPMVTPHQKSIQVGSTSLACKSTQHAHASDVGELCRRLRHEAGMLDTHPGRQELVEALAEGFTIDALVTTAINLDARKRNVGYLVARLRGQRADAIHNRTSSHASSGGHRPSVCDLNEQQDAEHTARERGGLRILDGGRK